MSRQRGGKTLIITDDEEEKQDELNPFSFKEFLRWKNQDQNHHPDQDQTHRKEEELEQSFQSFVDSSSSLCTNEEDDADEDIEEKETRFSSKPEGAAGGENYEGDDEISMTEAAGSCRGRSGRSSQVQQLKEENTSLRRTLRELQRRADLHQCRVSELSEELLQRRRQEEKEARDLESMVHSVEQNLQLMTRRAVKAENTVSRLKAELQQLQVEVDSLRSENNRLNAAESQVVMTMRQNAQVASEYLNKSASHAHSSIRQLLEEAETLRLVSHLLQSIDKISIVHNET
ncbi:endosome-associated-trafficking regulator 1 isoform X2 [Girardinichthys multiradiatus]|uniref:endosome-associated-trafficking regulator 1 isoform X2 n=2 Tax=Girardinichthys multiradiatus TaxID=208333 RepID=UPI001FAE737B|nr:endosome-associated-trafficking regulator 1 isoform X2 [Girardinichthys multiradiatus]